MNREVIKKNKSCFEWWLKTGEKVWFKCISEYADGSWYLDFPKWEREFTYIQNDEYAEFRKAQANGEVVQVKHTTEGWMTGRDFIFDKPIDCYRIRPKTININGYEVPEPVREPLKENKPFYAVRLPHYVELNYWRDARTDHKYLKQGLIHLTEEAAALHAKALLSFMEIKS